ncbi:MAG: caspase family protein [Pseudomonadota bacterium]
MRILIVIISLWAAGAFSPQALAANRAALIVGVSQYQSVSPLENPVNDARAIAGLLRNLEFDTTELMDPDAATLRSALQEFAFRAELADVALIYFSGHGIERAGQNYLLPVDTVASRDEASVTNAVALDDFLSSVDRARQLRIVILDSCRDDPFAALGLEIAQSDAPTIEAAPAVTTADAAGEQDPRSVAGGLAPPAPNRGTLVAYAAKHGQVAFDGTGGHGPYARALLEHMATPNLEIGMMFRRVRDEVMDATAQLQEPFTYGSLSGVPLFLANTEAPLGGFDGDLRAAWSSMGPDRTEQLEALAAAGEPRGLLGLAFIKQNPQDARYDPAGAIGLLRQAAVLGDPVSQFELAKALERGIGTAADPEEALRWFKASADQDFPDALNDMGFLTFQGGLGIKRDPPTAIDFFRRAAELRHPEAMYNFAAMIDDQLVEGKTPEDAAGFLFSALRTGNRDVLNVLTENPNTFTRATRRGLQRRLAERGYYTGTIDGLIGPQSTRSLRAAFGE